MYLRKYFSELFYLVNKISVGGFLPTEMSPANNNKNNNNFFKITDVRRVLRLLCAAHYARRSEFPSLARWKRPSAPDPPRPCAVSAGRSLLACEAASPAAQEPDAVAVFVVPICCHLDDQNRDQTVTPGTSQVGIFLLLFVHHVWQRKLVRALLLPAVVTLDEGNRIIFTGAKMLRKDAFSGGWEGVTAELLMVKTWSASSGGTGAFFHSRTPRPSRLRRQVRPPDRLTGAHVQPSELFHGHGSVRTCGFSAWSYRLTADAQRDELIGDGAYCHGCGTEGRRGCLLLAAGGQLGK